jgi:16S rRNA (cytosine1402-N4)-methyltransferase
MKDECIENLNIKDNGIYVDGTIGLAGHSSEILKRIPNGFLYGFDQDDFAVNKSTERLNEISSNFKIFRNNFCEMKEILNDNGIDNVDGILLDLGVSSPQIDNIERGFSFMNDAPLDMRMDNRNEIDASKVVNEYKLEELVDIFYTYGEEKFSKSIAKNIVQYRSTKEIETTLELVDIIKRSVPTKYFINNHPERQIFQAIRIEVNGELKVLSSVLPDAIDLLKSGGRLCVITFHSLEDRIVKQTFKKYSEVNEIVKGLPVIPDEYKPLIKIINNKPIIATEKEINENSRSRSAKLRIIERL